MFSNAKNIEKALTGLFMLLVLTSQSLAFAVNPCQMLTDGGSSSSSMNMGMMDHSANPMPMTGTDNEFAPLAHLAGTDCCDQDCQFMGSCASLMMTTSGYSLMAAIATAPQDIQSSGLLISRPPISLYRPPIFS